MLKIKRKQTPRSEGWNVLCYRVLYLLGPLSVWNKDVYIYMCVCMCVNMYLIFPLYLYVFKTYFFQCP